METSKENQIRDACGFNVACVLDFGSPLLFSVFADVRAKTRHKSKNSIRLSDKIIRTRFKGGGFAPLPITASDNQYRGSVPRRAKIVHDLEAPRGAGAITASGSKIKFQQNRVKSSLCSKVQRGLNRGSSLDLKSKTFEGRPKLA
jgi:hypothetical protein